MTSTTIAAETFELSKGAVLEEFGALVVAGAADAASIFNIVYGINDGNYYGRYFTAPAPLPPYVGSNDSVRDLIAAGAQLVDAVTAALATVITNAADPILFPQGVINLVGNLRRACANPADAIRILSSLAGFQTTVIGGSTDAIGAEITALAASAAVVMRRAAGISLAVASSQYTPSSQSDAYNVRNMIAGILDDLATEAADLFDDNMKSALDALQTAVVTDLTQRGGNLATVVQKKVAARLPAGVLAYRFYQDETRAVELVTRNSPAHPSFMPLVVEALAF